MLDGSGHRGSSSRCKSSSPQGHGKNRHRKASSRGQGRRLATPPSSLPRPALLSLRRRGGLPRASAVSRAAVPATPPFDGLFTGPAQLRASNAGGLRLSRTFLPFIHGSPHSPHFHRGNTWRRSASWQSGPACTSSLPRRAHLRAGCHRPNDAGWAPAGLLHPLGHFSRPGVPSGAVGASSPGVCTPVSTLLRGRLPNVSFSPAAHCTHLAGLHTVRGGLPITDARLGLFCPTGDQALLTPAPGG